MIIFPSTLIQLPDRYILYCCSLYFRCTDFLRFFVDLERPEVNERHTWKYEECGNITMIQKKHYSSSRSLILEFHTDSFQANHTGFRGRFKFIDKSMFKFLSYQKTIISQWQDYITYLTTITIYTTIQLSQVMSWFHTKHIRRRLYFPYVLVVWVINVLWFETEQIYF